VAFLADIEFKNVEFMNIFELSRASLWRKVEVYVHHYLNIDMSKN
jgi:hypothetical protein